MQKFLALYTGTAGSFDRAGWNAMDAEARRQREAAAMQAWADWGAKYAHAIVDVGGPLGRTKRVGPEGISDTTNALAAYVIVQAESHEEAAKMFEGHPHFSIFPGEAVEIMPCRPIPG